MKLDTRINGLNTVLGEGLGPGNTIGVIGCTGTGKTILAVQLVLGAITAAEPIPVAFFSTEVGTAEAGNRLLSNYLEIPYAKILNKTAGIETLAKGGSAAEDSAFSIENGHQYRSLMESLKKNASFYLLPEDPERVEFALDELLLDAGNHLGTSKKRRVAV